MFNINQLSQKINLDEAIYEQMAVITKTSSDHKPPQTTSKRTQTTNKLPQITSKRQQTNRKTLQSTRKQPQTTSKQPQTAQKADVSFLLPASANYKDQSNFENHKQSPRGNCLLISQCLCKASKLESACFGRLNNQNSSCQQEKSTFQLLTFKHKRSCFFCLVGISHLHFLRNSTNSQVTFRLLY